MEDKLRCANTTCRWNKGGRCRLFVGVAALECQYRIEPKTKSNNKKKGK